MADKKRLVFRLAAAFCAAAVIVSSLSLKTSEFDASGLHGFSPEPQEISALIYSDGSQNEKTDSGAEDENEDKDSSSSEEDKDISSSVLSQVPENNKNDSDTGERNKKPQQSTVYTNTNHSSSSQKDSSSDSGDKKPHQTDDGSHADTPGDRTQDGGETETEYFTTSIRDGERVSEEEYFFTITHLKKELKVRQTEVKLNGTPVPYSESIILSEQNGGKNKIRISVTYTDKNGKVISAFKSYTVYYEAAQDSSEPEQKIPAHLVTDLYNHTRSDPQLDFSAYVEGEAENVKVTVYHKTKKLKSDSGAYSCRLDMGLNRISIKAVYTDEEGEHTEQFDFEIKLIAETTEETAPYLAYQNVPSAVRGNLYTLDLAPRTYNGEKLYYNNLNVRLNGYTIAYSWDGEYTSYLLDLSAGENTLEIRVSDNEGRYTDYSYVISCLYAQDGDIIANAVLSVDADVLGLGVLLPAINIDIRQGEAASRTIVTALEQNGFEVYGTGSLDSGFYIVRLGRENIAAGAYIPEDILSWIQSDTEVKLNDNRDDNTLGEKQYTNASGWMICVNGHYLSYGTSDLHLTDGDVVMLRYTLAYGKDIGGYTGGGSGYDVSY